MITVPKVSTAKASKRSFTAHAAKDSCKKQTTQEDLNNRPWAMGIQTPARDTATSTAMEVKHLCCLRNHRDPCR